mmetsp:Transcript_1210/g.3033  ORF Transcript_1210/g.3033 Transcript_1210/m.3033 type:complete len:296 (-) Transcript_1210:87-974(-)
MALFSRLFQCCNTNHDMGGPAGVGELKVVQLSSDVLECQMAQPVHLLTQQDSFDMSEPLGEESPRWNTITPRLQSLRDRIWLPKLRRYPLPPGSSGDDPEDVRQANLLKTYQDFVLDLHRGLHMTQLTASQDYSDIHCQLLEDLQTLKVDQGSGCIVEFPLRQVSKVYRIVKNDDKWYNAGSLTGPTPMPPLPLSNAEHIVVVEFMRRKLAFVFNDIKAAQRFLMCIELLIRRAQEEKKASENGLRRNKGQMAPMFSGFNEREPERSGRSLLSQHSARPNNNVAAESSCGCQPAT